MRLSRLIPAALAVALSSSAAMAAPPPPQGPYLGADLSFANEMADCGAVYTDGGEAANPFQILRRHGGNLARIRLWNNPDWTTYSTLADVKKSIRQAHEAGLRVLLDFHYSDDWADGDNQVIPKAWAGLDQAHLEQALHDFTRDTLATLAAEGLAPDMVQVGNETNGDILRAAKTEGKPIQWARNAGLLNAGIRAVREAAAATGHPIRIMLHVAQPENLEAWFADAEAAGVTDFDIIGFSYYRKWSRQPMAVMGRTVNRMATRFDKQVLLVETAYPWTLEPSSASPSVLGEDSLDAAYPASPAGQRAYLIDVTRTVIENGGIGMVYWAPDWVSTRCRTRWGQGSTWGNAALFAYDAQHAALPGLDYLGQRYPAPVPVTLRFTVPPGAKPYFWAENLDNGDGAFPVRNNGGAVEIHTTVQADMPLRFQLFDGPDLSKPLLAGGRDGLVERAVAQPATIEMKARP
ncbi:glycoside hydrolase family 53 protein [Nitrospirillum iridis]|uniref:Arabinogalactan endo-beta-1,4-galactanase n=1 Tax=Nitrospirillum iridis TaxID=765888 RepID=A0A7X0AVS7_9PROT|nr:glycosyl hydrolase 53 family protein [Nitrospirillum iridis]MBB6251013.1 arabinogalactan endo-1,4-beta-galactosidase [Nitrospirillum iridis]